MDYDFRAAVEALTALQKRLTFNGHRIAEAYAAPPDQGYGVEAMPAWINSNPALSNIEMIGGAVLYTVSVDSNLFLREKGVSAATWDALGWWTAWLDLFHIPENVQLGGACVSARIRPARDGVLAGQLTRNGVDYIGLAMRHEIDLERFPPVG